MIEWIIATWLWIAAWPVLIGLVLFGVIMEYNDNHKFAAFLTLVSFGIAWTIFDEHHTLLTYLAIGYIPIGLVWSIWRWKLHCKKVIGKSIALAEEYFDGKANHRWKSSEPTRVDELQAVLNPKASQNIERIISWILCWPVSMIERAIGDFIEFIKIIALDWMGGIFNKITSSSVNAYNSELSNMVASRAGKNNDNEDVDDWVDEWKRGK